MDKFEYSSKSTSIQKIHTEHSVEDEGKTHFIGISLKKNKFAYIN